MPNLTSQIIEKEVVRKVTEVSLTFSKDEVRAALLAFYPPACDLEDIEIDAEMSGYDAEFGGSLILTGCVKEPSS